MINIIGWFGGIFLAVCSLPDAYKSIINGDSPITWELLILWYLGEWFSFIYVLGKSKEVKLLPLIVNYLLNIIGISIIMYHKVF